MQTRLRPFSMLVLAFVGVCTLLPIVAMAASGISGIPPEEMAKNWDIVRSQTGAVGVIAFILLISIILLMFFLIRWLLGGMQRDSLKREEAIRADMHLVMQQGTEREASYAKIINETLPMQAKMYADALGQHTTTLAKLSAGVDSLCQHVMAKTLDDASCAPAKRPRKSPKKEQP
jgi:uncharacterized membrane protein